MSVHHGGGMERRAWWTAGYILFGLTPAVVALRSAADVEAGIGAVLVAVGLVLGVGDWIVVLLLTPRPAPPQSLAALAS